MSKSSKKGVNTYFRQTAKAFRAARQTQVFSRIKRNIPYAIKSVSEKVFNKNIQKLKKSKKTFKKGQNKSFLNKFAKLKKKPKSKRK